MIDCYLYDGQGFWVRTPIYFSRYFGLLGELDWDLSEDLWGTLCAEYFGGTSGSIQTTGTHTDGHALSAESSRSGITAYRMKQDSAITIGRYGMKAITQNTLSPPKSV